MLFLSFFVLLLSVCSAEERVATNEPQFISTGKEIRIKEGNTLELECLVSDLGEFVLLWKFNRTQVLFAGNLRIHRDDRIARNDSTGSLTVYDFRAENAGEYSCQVSTNPPKDIVYLVQVQGKPIIDTLKDQYTIRRGDPINIECQTKGGNSQIQWKRGNRLLSRSSSLIIEKTDREDSGIYTCIASNEMGQVSRDTRIIVLYKPEVKVPRRVVHAPIGHSVIVECLVFSEPSPNVNWMKGTNSKVLPSDRVVVDRNETTATLKISDVIEADYDTYTCLANNSLGSASNRVVLSGRPSVPQFTSAPLAGQHTSYRLEWILDSESPITHYVIRWKSRDDQKWHETRVEPQNQESSIKRSFSFDVTSLEANENYSAEVRAHNRFGETVSDVFAFVTSLSHVSSPSALIALFLALSVQSFNKY